MDGKTKMFHKFSPYFLHFFFQFSPKFSKCQELKLFPSQVDGCLQAHWEGQGFFTPMNSSCAKIHESVARRLRQPKKRLRLCGTQTHLFSVATKVYDAKCLSCSYPRKKCHGNPKGSPLVKRFLLGQLETNG